MPPSRSTKENGLASLACTECRKQHLKCDANKPSCSRCLQNGFLCQYLPSRRGGRRKARTSVYQQPSQIDGFQDVSVFLMRFKHTNSIQTGYQTPIPPMNTSVSGSMHESAPSQSVPNPALIDISASQVPPPVVLPGSDTGQTGTSWAQDDRLPRLYYENFHAAHPILVPGSSYNDRNYPKFLQLAVNFIGSHYIPSSPSQQYKERVAAELASNPDRSPCMVQAWLIYSIGLYARDEFPESQDAFTRSVDLALELGMNRWDFVPSSHPETSIEAESMRRTWWELYVTDIFMAILLKTTTFRCSTVPPEVALPCEESAYNSGCEIRKPRTMLEFKRRIFAAEDDVFSSFSYRVEATMILCRVLVLNRLRDCHRDHLQAVENALVSWVNHLPPGKLDIVDSYGNVDEMMFQAHLTIAYAAMLLHLPRSDLQPILSQPDGRFWPGPSAQLSSTFTRLVHSIKAIEASRRVSDSISVCPNVQKHTPFIIPALALCGMIQLAISTKHSEECFDHHCNRVTLILGCLKSTKRTWSLAESAYHCLRSSSSEVLSGAIEKWNAEPLSRLIAPDFSPNDADRSNQSSRAGFALAECQDMMPPDLAPQFFDPSCYNASFFSVVPDLDIN